MSSAFGRLQETIDNLRTVGDYLRWSRTIKQRFKILDIEWARIVCCFKWSGGNNELHPASACAKSRC